MKFEKVVVPAVEEYHLIISRNELQVLRNALYLYYSHRNLTECQEMTLDGVLQSEVARTLHQDLYM